MANFQQYIGSSTRVYPTIDLTAVPGKVYDFGTLPVPGDGLFATSAGPATGVFDNANVVVTPTPMTVQAYASRQRPTRLHIFGPSYFKTTIGVASQDHRIDKRLAAILGVNGSDIINRSVSGAPVNLENPGGYVTALQQMPRTPRTAPYVAVSSGIYLIGVWNLNDLGKLVPSGDTGTVMAQIRAAVVHAYRSIISRCRASAVYEAESGSSAIVTSSFTTGTSTTFNSGAGTIYTATVGATCTFTIPADFPGGAISVGLVGAAGVFGGTITWSGTAAGATGTTSTSNILPVGGGVHGHLVKRFAGLTAADAGKTIIATVSAVDSGGRVDIDYFEIEAVAPPIVVVATSPRILTNSAYASFGNYWGNTSTPGSTGDGDVQASNSDLATMCAEFDSAVVVADFDAAMGKSAGNFGGDGIHPNEVGAEACAQAVAVAVDYATLSNSAAAHQDYPAIVPARISRVSGMDYGPPSYGGWNTITMSNATGIMFLVPYVVTEGGERASQFGIEITTSGTGSSVQLGVYNDRMLDGKVLELESDVTGGPLATTAAPNTSGLLTAMNLPLDPGLYYLACHAYAAGSVNAVLRAFVGPVWGLPVQRGAFAATPNAGYSVVVGAGVALPKRVSLVGAGLQSPVPAMTLRRS